MRLRAFTLTGLAACGLAGCGGGGDGKDEKQVRATVKEAMTTQNDNACGRLLTEHFVDQVSLGFGKQSIKQCRAGEIGIRARSVAIDRVSVNGSSAEADIRPTGGELPFKTATIGLTRSGARWKVSAITRGHLDRAGLTRVVRSEFSDPSNDIPAGAVECMLQRLSRTPERQIVRAYFDSDPRPLLVPLVGCFLTEALRTSGAPKQVVDCVGSGIRRELTTGAVGKQLTNGATGSETLSFAAGERLGRLVAQRCVRRFAAR
jgi:hypothetical protein